VGERRVVSPRKVPVIFLAWWLEVAWLEGGKGGWMAQQNGAAKSGLQGTSENSPKDMGIVHGICF
jgi:hypothetical protein